jgi:hypothetical protein
LGALTIAFDTTIVGALALPWVLLIIHLFFFEGENHAQDALDWVKKRELQTIAGVLLFAMAFTLGSAVSRIAQDFFNDDDLRIPGIFRMTTTEDRIIARVYCESDENLSLLSEASNPVLADKLRAFQSQKSNCCSAEENQQPEMANGVKTKKRATQAHKTKTCIAENKDAKIAATGSNPEISTSPSQPAQCPCEWIVNGIGRTAYQQHSADESDLISNVRDIFGLEENGLLLKGEDATLRLRQLHDQIMVLRGATFNGIVTFSFCLFAWGVRERRVKSRPVLRWALAFVPVIFLLLAGEAFYHHLQEREAAEPPYMEFSLLVIGLAGAVLLWRSRPLFSSGKSRADAADERDSLCSWRWGAVSLLFAMLSLAGILGWWATEVIYAKQVIYSYDSLSKAETKANQ